MSPYMIVGIIATCFFLVFSISLLLRNVDLRFENTNLQNNLNTLQNDYDNIEAVTRARLKKEYDDKLKTEINQFHSTFSQQSRALVQHQSAEKSRQELLSKLRAVAQKSISRISQELLGDINDELGKPITEIKDALWRCFQGFREHVPKEPMIFPPGTRIASTRGDRSVLFIEQPPMVRNTLFTWDSVENSGSESSGKTNKEGQIRFQLAFPYLYYVCVLSGMNVSRFAVYMSNRSLNQPDDVLYPLPFPNVELSGERTNGNYWMLCLNMDILKATSHIPTLSKQVEYLIGTFWSTAFTNHGKHHYKSIGDQRVLNLNLWEEASKENPLFACEVPWQYGISLRKLLDTILDLRFQSHPLDGAERAFRDIIHKIPENITHRTKGIVAIHQARAEDLPVPLQGVQQALEESLLSHSESVFKNCMEVRNGES